MSHLGLCLSVLGCSGLFCIWGYVVRHNVSLGIMLHSDLCHSGLCCSAYCHKRNVIRHNVVWPTVGVLSDSASYAESLRCVYSCLGLGSANPC